jgi:hypothetical protein
MIDVNSNKCIHEYECGKKNEIEIMQRGAEAWQDR